METLKNKRKLAAVTRETQEEHPRNGQSRNTSVPKINEEYNTQVSEEIEGRVTKRLSQEYSRTESRILGALSKLDEFLLNQQIRTHSGTVLETFRNTNVENQGMNEDDSQSDPHPEAGLFRSQTTQNSGPEVGPYMVTNATERHDMVRGVTEEVGDGPYMVTGAQGEILNGRNIVTAVQDEIFTAPLEFPEENKRRRAPQLNHNFAVRTPLRQLKQTRFCWTFSNCRQTVIQPISTAKS